MPEVITNNLDLWTSALLTKSTAGRCSNGKLEAYGIKKLRELIFELAVRGKLVPQDPNDEPACVLLERIEEEKERLANEGKCKKSRPLLEIGDEEVPFAIPVGWEWTILGIISQANTGYAFKSTEYTESGTFVLRVTNINPDGTINQDDKKYIDSKAAETTYEKFLLHQGDVLLVMVGGSLGKLGIVTKDCLPAVLNQNMWKLDRFGGIALNYFLMGLKYINNNQIKITSSTHGHLAQGEYLDKSFPLPPLDEQHRIVTKVDELMSLCDQLEQQQTNSIEAHQTLVETLLGTLTNVESQQELTEAWNRIANHFDTLFTTEHSIDQLKQTILQLAVMGKLVPQDPNDEAASVLLERIAEEKERLVKKGEIKKEKPLPEILEEEKPCEVPKQWEYARFGWLVNFKSELVKPEDFMDFDQVAPDTIEKGTGKLLYRRTVSESGVRGPNNKFYTGQILYSKIRPSLSKAIIAPFDGLCSADMYPLESMIDAAYLLKAILSEPFLEQVRIAENRIKMPKLNVDSLSRIVVPLPPLAEQNRIVAKVNELMDVCDALKACLNDAQTTQIYLADAIVEQAVV